MTREMKPEFFQAEAKEFAALELNRRHKNSGSPLAPPDFEGDDLYVVWFAKTLQNYKALISTDRTPGIYIEVTFDGDKKQAYVDVYRKSSNSTITREDLAQVLAAQENNA